MRSGRSARMTSSRWKPGSRFHSPGSGSFSGCSWSNHSFQRFHEPSMSAGSAAKASGSCSASAWTDCHARVGQPRERAFSGASMTLGAP